ncbi:hypothetical protein [Propionivibrio sp.]|uniref:hypothetical protein n=1 Tax=Propionivibrio sp. TaxID=2212460 RepID=UPI003BF1EFD8
MIALAQIRIDGGTQSRIELNRDVVAEYCESYRAGVQMPPVTVFYDGASFWLADGFHRFFGATSAGLVEIFEDRKPGTKRDAILYSLKCNAKHGLRRCNADKRKAVETLLADTEWSDWSDNEIAKRCAVSNHLVADVKKSHLENSKLDPEESSLGEFQVTAPTERTYTTKHGTAASMKTANIGKPAQPAKAAPAKPAVIDGECERIEEPDATGQSELEELRDFSTEQGQVIKSMLAEAEIMMRVFDADDRISVSLAEVKRTEALIRVLTERNNGLTNEKNEAIKWVKHWKRRAEKAEAALAKVEAGHAA